MPWIILKVVSGISARRTYGAYPYRPALAQELMPGDKERRFDFCNFVLNTLDGNPDFLNEVLWSDECQFSRQGTINTQNRHYWSLQNPHLIRPNRQQVRWSVNVWCGIWKSTVIGPIYTGVQKLRTRRFFQYNFVQKLSKSTHLIP
ncbi:uncharacterized protein TNCV_2964641 [Trichonephila clavipes]|nr:uncharacterized protein TNCV_2964641 [Trichonephila clavipes]